MMIHKKELGWILNPFIALKNDLTVVMEDKLLELYAAEGLNPLDAKLFFAKLL